MIFRRKRLGQTEDSEKQRYQQIGWNARLHGIDRSIADDFSVHYRPYIRKGWDEADAVSIFASLNINGNTRASKGIKYRQ